MLVLVSDRLDFQRAGLQLEETFTHGARHVCLHGTVVRNESHGRRTRLPHQSAYICMMRADRLAARMGTDGPHDSSDASSQTLSGSSKFLVDVGSVATEIC